MKRITGAEASYWRFMYLLEKLDGCHLAWTGHVKLRSQFTAEQYTWPNNMSDHIAQQIDSDLADTSETQSVQGYDRYRVIYRDQFWSDELLVSAE